MLLRNSYSFTANPGSFLGNGFFASNQLPNNVKPGMLRNFATGPGTSNGSTALASVSGYPSGYLSPASWLLPEVAGGLASRYTAGGTSTVSAAIAGGLNGLASLTGSGAVTANINWVIVAAAALTGLGLITSVATGAATINASTSGSSTVSADLLAAVSAAASLTGSSSLTAALIATLLAASSVQGQGDVSASLSGAVSAAAALIGSSATAAGLAAVANAAAPLSGTSSVVAAMRALGNLVAAINASGAVTLATPQAPADMSANLTSSGDILTTANVASSVWNALVAAYSSNPGTFAEAINQGAAGITQQQIRDALTLAATDTPAAGSIDRLLTELWRLSGLDPAAPLVVTPTARSTTDVDQTITTVGTTVTVERQ